METLLAVTTCVDESSFGWFSPSFSQEVTFFSTVAEPNPQDRVKRLPNFDRIRLGFLQLCLCFLCLRPACGCWTCPECLWRLPGLSSLAQVGLRVMRWKPCASWRWFCLRHGRSFLSLSRSDPDTTLHKIILRHDCWRTDIAREMSIW